ncbi:MAG TPA: CHASE sensor domain-containing protein, partial [Rhodocyclaceae bacterium]|nr:CHASE sensor domain-containing protein [Rhodocyclaceae bacterium]
MVRFRDISIRTKLMVIIMATCCTALFLGGGALIVRYAASEQEKAAERLTLLARVMASNVAAAVSFNEPVSAGEILKALAAEPSIVSARVVDSRGRVFARYGGRGGAAFDGGMQASAGQGALSLREFLFDRDSFRVATPIVLDGEALGSIVVDAGLGPLRASLLWDAAVLTAIIFASGLGALVLSHHLQKLVSDPISRLAEAMRSVSHSKDYRLQVKKDGNDEIGTLIDGFNDMLAEIGARDRQLEHLAHHDALTQLPNRVLFESELRRAMMRA